jgi:cytoskeletal protein CcmA (bactofilin family)
MQELLPVGLDQLNLEQLMSEVGTIISESVTINGPLESKTEEPVLVCGQVSAVSIPNATLIIGKTGVVTGAVNAKRLIHFGRIDPSLSGQTRTTVCALDIITAKDSVIVNCDVFYDRLQTHSGAKMPKVVLDETRAGPQCDRI